MITNEMQALNDKEQDFNLQFDINKKAAIMVIDDNHFNLVAAKLLLSEFGLACDIAISGKKGIKLYKHRLEMLEIDMETKPL